MIDAAYHRTLDLLQSKKAEVEKLAQALLTREVLHKSDVEELIGNRPFEEKTTLEVSEAESFAPTETTVDSANAADIIDTANATIDAADAAGNNE
jgi:cell division protease FtsH